ncbi:MBL fold metallo-hydrolase [Streptomyces sp. NPDC002952]|uniref:MBL fold metallo-hydrolase n=1 Tax=Streptomyces sp. NPDC002952 TaxID=3364673 RepID=UPI0036CF0EE9
MNPTGRITAAVTTLAATAVVAVAGSATACPGDRTPQPRLYTFTSDANGFDTQTHFLDTGKSVIAFDAQFTPEYARQALAYLRTRTDHPVKYVVVTHPNPDKFQGVPVFQAAGAVAVASEATAADLDGVWKYKKNYFVNATKMFDESAYPALPAMDKTFKQHERLTVDGVTVDLDVLAAPGVSTSQTIATIPALKSVVVGDLVHHDTHAWLEGGIVDGRPTPTLNGWKRDLDEIRRRVPARWTVYGGRGSSAPVDEAVTQQKDYLETAGLDVRRMVAALTPAQRTSALANPSRLVSGLTGRLTAQYPSYRLPYMIGYGSYGLVTQHLAH